MTESSPTVLIGPYRSGKTQAILERLLLSCQENPWQGATVIVPSFRYKVVLESRLTKLMRAHKDVATENSGSNSSSYANFGYDGIAGLWITTLSQFCRTLLVKTGNIVQEISDHVRISLLTHVLNSFKPTNEIPILSEIVDLPGTHASLLALIDEFERAALSPSMLMEKLDRGLFHQARYLELAKIYAGYKEVLTEIQVQDRRQIIHSLVGILSQSKILDLGIIAFEGFDRFNSLQLQVIDALKRHSRQLFISFDYLPLTFDKRHEYLWKQNSFEQLNKTLGNVIRYEQFPTNYEGSERKLPSQKPLQIGAFLVADRNLEMVKIASIIKERIVSQGKQQKDFLVVVRELAPYRNAIQLAFSDAGLSVFPDDPIAIGSLPIVQFISALFRLILDQFPRAQTIFCLRHLYFNRATIALTDADCNVLNKYSLDGVVVKGRPQWLQAMAADASGQFTKKLTSFFDILTPPVGLNSLTAFVVWVEDVLDKFLLLPEKDEFADQYQTDLERKALLEFRKLLAILLEEETLLTKLGKSFLIPFEAFLTKLEHLLEQATLPAQVQTDDHVLVCSADLAPNCRYDEVFVAGLAEGEFPRRTRSQGFVSLDEIEVWSSFGIDLHNPRLDPNFEPALFYSLLERARKNLYLSCPVRESSGEEITPSFLLTEAAREHGLDLLIEDPFEKFITAPNSARNAIAAKLLAKSSVGLDQLDLQLNLNQSELMQTTKDALAEPLATVHLRKAATRANVYNGYLVDCVTGGTVKVNKPDYWSASRLNEYGKCPFRYWLSYVLKTEPWEEPVEGLTSTILGEFYHRVLESFYRQLLASGQSMAHPNENALLEVFEQALGAGFHWLEKNPAWRRSEFWDYEKQELRFRLKRFFQLERQRAILEQEEFTPYLLEASFGFEQGDSYPPLILHFRSDTGEIAPVKVRGRVDRIDVSQHPAEEGGAVVRVVDYKAGSGYIGLAEAKSGRNVQLPLYAMAVQSSIMPNSRVKSGQYLSIASGNKIGSFGKESKKTNQNFDESENVDNLLEQVKSLVVDMTIAADKGNFTVQPNGYKVCDACKHQTICRVSELNQELIDDHEID